MRGRTAAFALYLLLPAAMAAADAPDWRFGFRSSLDFGSFALEQEAHLVYRDAWFLSLDLVTNPKIFFMTYPGGLESNGMQLSWRYNIDLETRLEAGWQWSPWDWLSLRAGLDASLLLNMVDYDLSNETYAVHFSWSNAYWIMEPAAFASVDLDYGAWFHTEAVRGLDARIGIRVPLRDIYYDYERWRLVLSLGWEY